VKLVVSDAHEGIKAAVSRICSSTGQRCRVHFMRNALAHASRSGKLGRVRRGPVVSAFIATAFAQNDAKQATAQWRRVADQLRPKVAKLVADGSSRGGCAGLHDLPSPAQPSPAPYQAA
jgi:putative transposase